MLSHKQKIDLYNTTGRVRILASRPIAVNSRIFHQGESMIITDSHGYFVV